ncbi:MAG: histidine kinase [Micropruina sp.]|uniref:sensor histidine kinase n=1 Tax=Micropruina sp. TaxID=2737536 RepID=UPI0039E21F44
MTSLATAASGAVLLTELGLRSAGIAVDLRAVAGLALGPIALAGYPRFAAGRSRLVGWTVLLVVAGCAAVALARPESADGLGIVIAFVLIGHAWWVIERATPADRSAAQWMIAAVVFALLAGGLFGFGYGTVAPSSDRAAVEAVGYLLALLIPVAMTIGVVEPELVDVRWLVTTITVTVAVVVCFLAAASTLVFGLEALTGQPFSTSTVLTVCALLALGVAPARRWLYGSFERMLFGGRPDPIGALASFAGRIGSDLADALDAIREALVLPFVRLDVTGRSPVISGTEVPHLSEFALDVGPGRTATLVIGLRPGERTWSRADLGVVSLVAPLVASTVRAQLLAEQVSASRGEAVAAIEDERRRLRRDLHDGVGPLLSGVVFTADAAGNLLDRDPAAAAGLLADLRADAAAAIVEVRQLVEGLRPPALDELGLIGALRTWCNGLRSVGGVPIAVEFEGERQVAGLSAAAEAAAYRIAVEALTNVARHSGAQRATLGFTRTDDGWQMEVRDPGIGGTWTPGGRDDLDARTGRGRRRTAGRRRRSGQADAAPVQSLTPACHELVWRGSDRGVTSRAANSSPPAIAARSASHRQPGRPP